MLRRLLHALVIVVTLIVGATVAAVVVTQTAWFKNWLRGYIVREANGYLNGELAIGRLAGNLFYGVQLENVAITLDGAEVVAVDDIGLRYNAFQIITKGLSIDEISLARPVIQLTKEGDGWNLARLVKAQAEEADREGPASPIAINTIGIHDASILLDPGPTAAQPVGTSGASAEPVRVPTRIDGLDAKLAFSYEPVRYSLQIDHVAFRTSEPHFELRSLSGGVAVREDTVYLDQVSIRTAETSLSLAGAIEDYLATPRFSLSLSSDKLSIPEIAAIVPALADVRVKPAFELKVNGPLEQLRLTMDVRSEAGQVSGQLEADAVAPGQSVKGDIAVRHLDLSAFVPTQPKSDLSADLSADLKGESLSDLPTLSGGVSVATDRVEAAGYTVERLRAAATLGSGAAIVKATGQAYGIDVSANGRVTLPAADTPVAYDLNGAIRRVSLRRLPASIDVPRVDTDISLDYRVRGTEPAATAGERSVDADLTFAPSSLPGAAIAGGSTARAAIRGERISYAADATIRDADLVALGQAFDVAALKDERYRSTLNLHVAGEGQGTSLAALKLQASGELTDSTILGGRIPNIAFTAAVADDTAHVTARGGFEQFNPAALSGDDRVKGDVAGEVDVDASITALSAGVTADTVGGDLRLSLKPSAIGGLVLESVRADVAYRDRTAEVRAFEVIGRDLNVTAMGLAAVGDVGDSNLQLHVDTPRLQEIGGLFEVPVEGIARVDATLTGNRQALHVAGTLTGNGVKYQDNGALSATSTFTADIANLDAKTLAFEAETSATFVSVAGQNVNELQAKTTYEQEELAFEMTASQPDRTLSAGGAVSLETDRQELRLRSLAMSSRGVALTLSPGTEATVRYGGDAVSIDGLRLRSGDAEIAANGTFGAPQEVLSVNVANLDLAIIDALLLREPQLSGRFDADATIAGNTEAPQVDGTFSVANGGFRQFRYDAFTGTLRYVPAGVTVDARLQQNPAQWLTAKGFLPAALFAGDKAEGAAAPAATGDAERIDLTVDSSPIDLGVVQGFTTAVTEVTGTAEAHIRLTGTADRPEPDGGVTIQNGAMKVVPTGTEYRNIAARLRLDPDRLRIEELTVLDNHDSALSLVGDVALDERRVSGVQLYLNADDFKVIDNELGNVRIQSSLELSGDLRAPRIGGFLGVTTGEVNLDNVLASVGSSPYPTAAAPGSDEATAEEPASTGSYANSSIDVELTVPNALVLRGDSLQTPGSPISLGALNLTLGGNVRATKKPGDIIRLVGSVNTIRGTYDFQGRRFEILRDGSVRFVGLDDFNPTLDLRTRRIIQGVEARVNIRGTLKQPAIELSSTPPLEEADILSLIVFNQPINQLGEGQQVSLAARAQALATGAVAGQLAQSIGNALNLDTFEIDVAPENGGGPQVTFGQQLGERLFVKVQQGIGEQTTTNLVLEYELANWLRLQTSIVQGASTQQSLFRRNQGSGADLIFFLSY